MPRRIAVLAALVLTATLTAAPSSPADPVDPTLVAAYAFDDGAGTTAADSSGNGRAGTLAGPTWSAGRTGGALSFDGVNDRVGLPPLGTFYNDGFTLMAWIKPSAAKRDVAIAGTWVSSLNGGPMLWVSNEASQRYYLTLSKGLPNYVDSTHAPVVGAWQHLAGTFDGTTARVYLDGVLVASKPWSGLVGNSNNWLIGAYGGTVGHFAGLIDEVRVYSRALDGTEIRDAAGIAADSIPPSAPADFVLTASTQSSIATSWSASTDNDRVIAYDVYRDGTHIASTNATSFTFAGLTCATKYLLEVVARDAAGNPSSRTPLAGSTSGCSGGLVASYDFEETPGVPATGQTAPDTSGNGFHGHIYGAAWTPGHTGTALAFHGGGEHVELPPLGTFYKTGFTLMAWVRKDMSTGGDQGIVGTWSSSASGGPMIWLDNASPRQYWLTMNKGSANYLASGATPVGNAWQHLAATYDGERGRFFVDGREVASMPVPLNIGDSNIWKIGTYGPSLAGGFSGAIDEVKIYDRSLSQSELRASAGITGTDLTPPTAPHSPGWITSFNEIHLNWQASTDDVGVTSYKVSRDGVLDGATSATIYSARGLVCGRSYAFAIRAYDAGGNESAPLTFTAATEPCVGGLMLAYGYEENGGTTLHDSSPNRRDGLLVGTSSGYVPGRFGKALAFGSDGYANMPFLGSFYRSGFTLSTWLRRTGAASDTGIMGSWVSASGGGPMLWLDAAGKLTLTLGKGSVNYLVTSWTPPLDEWHYVAGTFDGTSAKVYVDGVEIASRSVTSDVGNSSTWRLGAYGPAAGGRLRGYIDETRIYDLARTAAEIQTDMASPVSP